MGQEKMNRFFYIVLFLFVLFPLELLADSSSHLVPKPVFSSAVINSPAYRLGVLYWSMDIPCQVDMRNGLETAVEAYNRNAVSNNLRQITLIPHVAGNGDEGIERQIIQMHELVKAQVDLIIVQPTDNAALSKALQAANKNSIPVIAYDQYITGGKLHSFITSDNYQAGYLDGEYIASNFKPKKTINIILVDYPHVSSTVSRVDGFFDALDKHKQSYTILSTYEAVEPVGGQKAARQILNDFPEAGSIDVIFTVNDGGGLSIVEALLAANRHEIMVATVDGDPKSIDYLRQGDVIVIDSAQFCTAIGKEAFLTASDVLNQRKVAGQKLIPVFPITQETIHLYPGWQGNIPVEFTKPWDSFEPIWTGDIVSKIVVP